MQDFKDFAVFGKYRYYDLKCTLKGFNASDCKRHFAFIQRQKDKLFFIGFITYPFYKYLQDETHTSQNPCVVFYGFKRREIFKAQNISSDFFMPEIVKPLNKAKYKADFIKVKNAIKKGQSYQVNLTQEIIFKSKLSGFALFNLLSKRQDTALKAYIKSQNCEILSFSPELFFKTNKRQITTMPMKGTIRRGKSKQKDMQNKAFLKSDIKNISENVMIVDLLRNDLSKIIRKNTMKTSLFKIKSYPTLHQMISTIKGDLKGNAQFYDIFQALFPCGSITGAPKIETIDLISHLERRDRGIYCGSIGLIHKDKSKFSVAIRTLCKNGEICTYGVGSGLVWDSNAKDEFKELQLKSKILEPKNFYLFETMLFKNGRILFFKEHIGRLLESALKLSFNVKKLRKDFSDILNAPFEYSDFSGLNLFEIDDKIFRTTNSLFYVAPFDFAYKSGILKLTLYKNGEYKIAQDSIKESKSDILLLGDKRLDSTQDNLAYKSSLRGIYDEVSVKWKSNLCYDIAFLNERGEVCEGSRSNIIIKKGDEFLTPSLKSGLLNGIYRQFLLQQKAIKESVILQKDLSEVFCINSVRGLKKVRLK